MPELPEVTTTTNGLQKVLPSLVIQDVWTDLAKDTVSRKDFLHTIKNKKFFQKFKKEIVGKKVIKVERRAKNILIHLEGNNTILIHLKMTGHLLFGNYVYNKKENTWAPHKEEDEAFHDPYNRFIHVFFSFLINKKEKHLAFCDSRKFGKVTLIPTNTMHDTMHLKGVGPEPLNPDFSFDKFQKILTNKNGKIKTILMDQYIIAGIGNIYSDEMLWLSGIHPESLFSNIPTKIQKKLFDSMKDVLNKGIDFGGDSMSDYRDINGKKGNFQNHHNVYRKTNEHCGKRGCNGVIIRKVVGGRSAHFCNIHQIKF